MDTPLEILTFFGALVGLVTGIYTLITILQRPRLTIHAGDEIIAHITRRQNVRNFKIGCSLVNNSAKMATLQRLDAKVTEPNGRTVDFMWNFFYDYFPQESLTIRKATDPHAITVAPKASEAIFVDFETFEATEHFTIMSGRYKFEIFGWVNQEGKSQEPKASTTFHIEIEDVRAAQIIAANIEADTMRFLVTEWQSRRN